MDVYIRVHSDLAFAFSMYLASIVFDGTVHIQRYQVSANIKGYLFSYLISVYLTQVTVVGAESPRADEQWEEDVKKEELIMQEDDDGEEKKDKEKAVPCDGEQPAVVRF